MVVAVGLVQHFYYAYSMFGCTYSGRHATVTLVPTFQSLTLSDDSLYDITDRKPEALQGIDNLTVWEEAGGTGRVDPWGDSMP